MMQASSVLPFLERKGLSYESRLIDAFLLSIRTRPFVILAGLSGTGKTALPRALGELLTTGQEAPPIAVNPDWQDNADMMGYIDLKGEFKPGEFIQVVKSASADPGRVYIALLDEMNLAPVEQYFAQYLSVLESRKFDQNIGKVVYEDFCFNPAFRERLRYAKGGEDYADLRICDNLIVIGTVNVDESTTPFSRKVLDRANVIMFDEVNLKAGLLPAGSALPSSIVPAVSDVVGDVTCLKDLMLLWPRVAPRVSNDMPALLDVWTNELAKFIDVLVPLRASFGLRVRDDVLAYLAHYSNVSTVDAATQDWWKPGFDQQLMQRIFPRITAEQGGETILVDLLSLCVGVPVNDVSTALRLDLTSIRCDYKAAAKHAQRMLRSLVERDMPVVGFWAN